VFFVGSLYTVGAVSGLKDKKLMLLK